MILAEATSGFARHFLAVLVALIQFLGAGSAPVVAEILVAFPFVPDEIGLGRGEPAGHVGPGLAPGWRLPFGFFFRDEARASTRPEDRHADELLLECIGNARAGQVRAKRRRRRSEERIAGEERAFRIEQRLAPAA